MMALLVKNHTSSVTTYNGILTADNKDAFRRYKGVEVLIEMLKIHKSAHVAKALSHVLSGNGNFIATTFLVLTFCLLEISVDKYKSEIGELIGKILCEGLNDEDFVESLVDLLLVLNSENTHFEQTDVIVKGICLIFKKFYENEKFCLKFMMLFDKNLSSKDGKHKQIEYPIKQSILSRETFW